MIGNLVWSVGITIALVLFYQHLRVKWPANYFGPAPNISIYVSATGLRFFLFRFAPPFAAFLVVGMYASTPRQAIWCSASAYVIVSTGLSVRSSRLEEEGSVRLTRQRTLVLMVIAFGIASSAYLAIIAYPSVRPIAPSGENVFGNLIGSAVTAVIVILYLRATEYSGEESERPDSISEEMIVQIKSIAIESCVDQGLAVSIALVENSQRPPWFRSLERRTARWNREGSFGLFQVRGHGPVDDIESCRLALASLTGAFPLLGEYGYVADWSLLQAAERHNPDSAFAQGVLKTYRQISHAVVGHSEATAEDGRPVLTVSGVSRFAGRMVVQGDYWAKGGSVVVFGDSVLASPSRLAVEKFGSGDRRRTWRAEVPEGARRVAVGLEVGAGELLPEPRVSVDFAYVNVERDLSLRVQVTDPRPG